MKTPGVPESSRLNLRWLHIHFNLRCKVFESIAEVDFLSFCIWKGIKNVFVKNIFLSYPIESSSFFYLKLENITLKPSISDFLHSLVGFRNISLAFYGENFLQ